MSTVVQTTWKKYVPLLIVFLLGLSVDYALPKLVAFAHGGDTNLIHACVKNSNGSLRIVGENDTCGNNETPLDWSISGVSTSGSPYITGTGWTNFGDIFLAHDFSHSYFGEVAFQSGDMSGANFSNAQFYGGNISEVDLTTANFGNTIFRNHTIYNSDLTGANFTNAHFVDSGFNTLDLTGIDFSSATFEGTNVWLDTICPDGTFSNDNGDTCAGHLSP